MAEPCTTTRGCQRPAGHIAHHPCGGKLHKPGDPCEHCGQPLVADEHGAAVACPNCWTPITVADLKALAAGRGWDTILTIGGADRG